MNWKLFTWEKTSMEWLLRQNLIGRIVFTRHDVNIHADAKWSLLGIQDQLLTRLRYRCSKNLRYHRTTLKFDPSWVNFKMVVVHPNMKTIEILHKLSYICNQSTFRDCHNPIVSLTKQIFPCCWFKSRHISADVIKSRLEWNWTRL